MAAQGAHVVTTDVWASMGQEDETEERAAVFSDYAVNEQLMEYTDHAKFMHCLPAFHNRETQIGEKIYQQFGIDCMEVTEEVFESSASIVFDQSENRMHTIKAMLVATIGG